MKLHNEKGISLVELLAAVTISALLIGGITALLFQANQGFRTITSKESVQEDGRVITEQIVNKIRSQPFEITSDSTGSFLQLKDTGGKTITYRFVRPKLTVDTKDGTSTSSMTLSDQVDDAKLSYVKSEESIEIHLQLIGNSKPYDTSLRLPPWK